MRHHAGTRISAVRPPSLDICPRGWHVRPIHHQLHQLNYSSDQCCIHRCLNGSQWLKEDSPSGPIVSSLLAAIIQACRFSASIEVVH